MSQFMKEFGDFSEEFTLYNASKIVILPIPFDATSTWLKGADNGPEAILEASFNLEFYDIETDFEVYKLGIHTADPIVAERNVDLLVELTEQRALKYIEDDKFLVSLGGEHSVSIGLIRAFAKKFENLTVLQIDAHSDLRDQYHGSPYNHACVMARAKEVANIVQVGIRSMDVSELKNVVKQNIFYANDIRKDKNWIEKVLDRCTNNVYLTFDLDGLDPSVLPATGTPEPGGLLWYDVVDLMDALTSKKNLVGMDIVELCPNPYSQPSNFLAAKFIYKTLSLKFSKIR